MTDEVANLVLEILREIRADLASARADMDGLRSEMRSGFAAADARMNGIESEMRGIHYIMSASVGSLVGEVQDHEARIVRLETLRP